MELQSSMPPLNFLHCLIKLLNVEDSPNFYGYLCLISSVCSNCLRIIQILLDRRSLLHSVKRFGEITLLFFNCLQISFSETLQNCPILALFISEQWVFELSNLQLQLQVFNSLLLIKVLNDFHYCHPTQKYFVDFDIGSGLCIESLSMDQLPYQLLRLELVCQPLLYFIYLLFKNKNYLKHLIYILLKNQLISVFYRFKNQKRFKEFYQVIKFINQQSKQLHKMRQPTTIAQYKQFCKALKLKILKQKTTIESQNQQIQKYQSQIKSLKKSGLQIRNQNDPNSAFASSIRLDKTKNNIEVTDLQSLAGKNQIMNKFKNGVCSFGITPQSVFRIADFGYKNQVQSDYFRQVLSKIDLGLTPIELSYLIYIFDQNCTGFINKEDYNDALNAYRISLQQSYLYYTNNCLEKFTKLLEADKIQINKFFQQMQGKNVNSVNLNRFYEKVKGTFNKRMQNRQIMGTFNAMDLQNDGIVCKKNFIYSVTSAMNKITNQSQSRIKKSSLEDHVNPSFQRSGGLSASGKRSGPTPFIDNNPSTISSKVVRQKQSNNENQADPGLQQQTVSNIYNKYRITLTQIYEEICRKPLKTRLTLVQFKKILQTLGEQQGKIDSESSSLLFKLMDTQQKGTIHYRQLISFYLQHATDMSIIFQLIGIYFKNNDLNSENFWNMFGVTPDSDLSKTKFLEIMAKTFSNKAKNQNQLWEKLWGLFDKGRGVVSVAQINKELKKYQHSQQQQP